MENSYGIGVRNRYELFYDDDVDPLDLLKQTEKKKKDKSAEKENKATKAPKAKELTPVKKSTKSEITPKSTTEKTSNAVITKPTQTKAPRNNETRVKFSDREERNNRRNKPEGEQRENRENRDFRENRDAKDPREPRENAVPSQRFDGGDTRGGGRGRGTGFNRGRGGRRGTGGGRGDGRGDFRGKREFDRQSGMVTSGVKPVDKREGSGSFNWGSDKDQITDEQLQNDNAELDTSGENAEKPPVEDGVLPTEEDAAKEDDGQKEMTLDEWKALQKRDKPVFKIRRPGEGENTAQWKKTYVLKKKVEEETSEEEEEEDEEIEVHHGRKKVLLPFDFKFADTPSRGRGRGRGRGGVGGRVRGMGGRGSRYQGGTRQEAPKMDDERDFPSLG